MIGVGLFLETYSPRHWGLVTRYNLTRDHGLDFGTALRPLNIDNGGPWRDK